MTNVMHATASCDLAIAASDGSSQEGPQIGSGMPGSRRRSKATRLRAQAIRGKLGRVRLQQPGGCSAAPGADARSAGNAVFTIGRRVSQAEPLKVEPGRHDPPRRRALASGAGDAHEPVMRGSRAVVQRHGPWFELLSGSGWQARGYWRD